MNTSFENAKNAFITIDNQHKTIKSIYKTINGVYVKIYPNAIPLPEDLALLLIDFEYISNDNGTVTLTAWKETYQGVPSNDMVIPADPRIIY